MSPPGDTWNTEDATLSPDGAADSGPEPDEAASVLLNEIVCKPTSGADWFELYAAPDAPAQSLQSCTVADDDPDHDPAALPGVTLAPGERLVVFAGGDEPTDGSPWVPFKLGKADALTLTCAGVTVDSLDWEDGDAPEGASWGRLADGGATTGTLDPTPGDPNQPFSGTGPDDELTPDSPFDPTRVVTVSIELTDVTWPQFVADAAAESYVEASIVFDGVALERVAVRTKGNSSLSHVLATGSDRFSLKVDVNAYEDQTLLGAKKLNFNNGFKDPTFLREHLAYEMMRAMDVPAPRTAFVDLWVSGEHLGLYTMVEAIDGTFCDAHFPGGEGDLYKPDNPGGTLQKAGDDFASYGGVELKSNEDTSDGAAFMALIDALNPPGGGPGDVDELLDVDETLRYLAVSTALANLDSYQGTGHNYYLYDDDGAFVVLPWDLNEAFAVFTCGCSPTQLVDLPIHEPTCNKPSDRPLVEALLVDPTHRAAYDAHLGALIDDLYPEAEVAARVAALSDLIRPSVEADPRRFFTVDEFESALTDGPGGLGDWVPARWQSIRDQLAGLTPATASGQGACPGQGGGGGGPKPSRGP